MSSLDYDDGALMIFDTMLIVSAGTVIYFNLAKIGVPYPVAMFAFGMLLGFFSLVAPPEYDPVARYYDQIPPNLLFHIFLPLLVFEGSYGIKPFALRRVARHALLLATVGVLINTVIIAGAVKLVFGEWSWYLSLLLGSILSATDPVAVVSLLKDLGVNADLTACVDAEAIMNDGTAIILFQILTTAAEANAFSTDAVTLVLMCIRLTAVCCILGFASGVVLQAIVTVAQRDSLVCTITSVSFAYIMYYVADVVFQTSGVLTLFCAGIYLSRNVPSMFPGSHTSLLHTIWHFLVHTLNTLIFTMVGIIITRRIFGDFDIKVIGIIIFMYLVCNVGRMFMVAVLLPFMNFRSEWQITWKSALILTYGGLRGGVATILALVTHDDSALPLKLRNQFLEVVCGIVMLTTIVNATTSGKVVDLLNLQAKRTHRHLQMRLGMKKIHDVVEDATVHVKQDNLLRTSNWAEVTRITSGVANPFGAMDEIPEDAMDCCRAIAMRVFKTSLFAMRDRGRCSEAVLARLFLLTQAHISTRTLLSASEVREDLHYPWYIRWTISCCCAASSERVQQAVESMKQDHDKYFFSLLATYGDAVDRVEAVMREFELNESQTLMIEEWIVQERAQLQRMVQVFQQEKVHASISVVTAIAATEVLQLAQEAVMQMHAGSGLSQFDTNALVNAVADGMRPIDVLPRTLPEPSAAEMFTLSPLGAGISPLTLQHLSEQWMVTFVPAGSSIGTGRDVGVVVRGIVVCSVSEQHLVAGTVWGVESQLVTSHKAQLVSALADVLYVCIPHDAIREACAIDSVFASRVRDVAARSVCEKLCVQLYRFASWGTSEAAIRACKSATVILVREDAAGHPHFLIADTGASMEQASHDSAIGMFVSGREASGIAVEGSTPFVIPSHARFRWREGTIICQVRIGTPHSSTHPGRTSRPVPGRASASQARHASSDVSLLMTELAVDDESSRGMDDDRDSLADLQPDVTLEFTPTKSAATASRATADRADGPTAAAAGSRAVPSPALPASLYDPSQCATVVPYFNRAQLHFVAARELLARVASTHRRHVTFESRIALAKATDRTLQILSTYCVSTLQYEEKIFQLADMPGRLASQRSAHDELRFAVTRWLQARSLGDPHVHREVLQGMVLYQSRHFPDDAADMRRAANQLGLATLSRIFVEVDFDAIFHLSTAVPLSTAYSFAGVPTMPNSPRAPPHTAATTAEASRRAAHPHSNPLQLAPDDDESMMSAVLDARPSASRTAGPSRAASPQ